MHRRRFLAFAALLLPGAALAQTAAEREERHRWLDENWDSLPPAQRQEAEQRFRRGMGAQGPGAEEMRQRWQSMTPGQRRELMYGPGMGRHDRMRHHGGMGARDVVPPPAPPAPPPPAGPAPR